MHLCKAVPSFLLFATVIAAQNTITSPTGAATTEGADTFAMFGNRRLQGIDADIPGPILNIVSIGFRRDGNSTNAGGPRTMDVSVTMGHGPFATYSNTWAANFTSSTNVVANRPVNFPDWTTPPATPPAPFTFVIPFDAPWSWNGQEGLIWDISCSNSTVTSQATMDRFGYSTTTGVAGDVLGTGCIATGRTAAFSHTANTFNFGPTAARMELRLGGSNAPSSAPVFFALDLVDPDFSLPGLCANLRTAGTVVAPLTTSSSTGSITTQTLQLGYNESLIGIPVYTQLVALDAGQPGIPVVVSNGRRSAVPPFLSVGYLWGSTTSATGTLILNSTVPVAQFTF